MNTKLAIAIFLLVGVSIPWFTKAGEEMFVQIQLNCAASVQGTLYDTPSGDFEKGYWKQEGGQIVFLTDIATSSLIFVNGIPQNLQKATPIGKRAKTFCFDSKGGRHVFTIPNSEYEASSRRGGKILTKQIIVPSTDVLAQ